MNEETIDQIEEVLGVSGFEEVLAAVYDAYGETPPADPDAEPTDDALAEVPEKTAAEVRRDVELNRQLSERGMTRKQYDALKRSAVRRS